MWSSLRKITVPVIRRIVPPKTEIKSAVVHKILYPTARRRNPRGIFDFEFSEKLFCKIEMKVMSVKSPQKIKNCFSKPNFNLHVTVIFNDSSGTVTANSAEIMSKIVKFRSTFCLCSGRFWIEMYKSERGERTWENKTSREITDVIFEYES